MVDQPDGLKELADLLATLPRTVARREMQQDALAALKPFVDAWKAGAPVDADPASTPKRAPGTYRDSIHAGTRLNKSQAKNVKREGKQFAEAYAGTNDPAGVQTEFGNAHQSAQPAGRSAWDATQQEVVKGVGARMWGRIEKVRAKQAAKAAK